MSKFKIATRLAEKLGTTTDEAMQFVDDLGASAADRVAVNVSDEGGKAATGISNYWKAAGAAGTVGGGGALLWRQQDVERAKHLAEGQQAYGDTMRDIVQSDLPPDLRAELARDATEAAESGGGGGGGGGGGNPLGFLSGLMESPQTLLVLVIILAVVVNASGGN